MLTYNIYLALCCVCSDIISAVMRSICSHHSCSVFW